MYSYSYKEFKIKSVKASKDFVVPKSVCDTLKSWGGIVKSCKIITYDIGKEINLSYQGETLGDAMHGKGCIIEKPLDPKGGTEIYMGTFVHNKLDLTKEHIIQETCGSVFRGSSKHGTLVRTDQYEKGHNLSRYQQEIMPEEEKKDFRNRYIIKDLMVRKYTGEWENGYFHGNGELIYKCGSRFIGEFRHGQRHHGDMHYFNGDYFSSVSYKDDTLHYPEMEKSYYKEIDW